MSIFSFHIRTLFDDSLSHVTPHKSFGCGGGDKFNSLIAEHQYRLLIFSFQVNEKLVIDFFIHIYVIQIHSFYIRSKYQTLINCIFTITGLINRVII